MEREIKRHIFIKAMKISYYLMTPRTDEQFFKRKKHLEEQYSRAKRNYIQTSDNKYKLDMRFFKFKSKENISRTEFEKCLEDIASFKRIYCGEEYTEFWKYIDEIMEA